MRKKIHSGEMNVHLETFIFIIGRGKKKKKKKRAGLTNFGV
jgi:hypothetical protein